MTDEGPTRWSRIEGRDYDYLVRTWWLPVRRYLAARLESKDQAEDLTQELFLHFIEKDLLGRVDPARGPFRRFLYHAARCFAVDRLRADQAAKRGGGATGVPLEDLHLGAAGPAPDEEFDRQWYLSLLNRARRDLQHHYEERGRTVVYEAFRLFVFGREAGEDWSQQKIAEHLGLTVMQVKNYVRRAKAVYHDLVRGAIEEYAGTEEEIEAELAELRQVLHSPRDGSGEGNEPGRDRAPS